MAGKLAIVAAVVCVAGLFSVAAFAAEPAAPTAEQINDLVKKLGDENFKTREQAQADLTKIGAPAKDALTKAVGSSDAEVKNRATAILADIARNAVKANTEAILKNIAWSFEMKDGAAAGPVLADGVLWVLGSDNKCYGVDLATGKKASEAAPEKAEGLGNLCSAGDKFFLTDSSSNVYAFEGKTGKLAWKYDAPAPAANPAPVGGAVINRPAIARLAPGTFLTATDELVVLADGQKLTAITAKDGKKKWDADAAGVTCRPAVGGDFVYVCCNSSSVMAFEIAGGKLNWSANVGGSGLTYADGAVYFAQGTQVTSLDAKTGKTNWSESLPQDPNTPLMAAKAVMIVNGRRVRGGGMTQLAARDGVVYAAVGQNVAALKAKDGVAVWNGKAETAAADDANGVNGRVVVAGGGGNVAVARVNLVVAGGPIGAMGAVGDSPIILTDKALIVPGLDAVNAFDLKTGFALWSLKVNGAVSAAPLTVKDMLYFATADSAGKVPAIRPMPAAIDDGSSPKEDDKPAANLPLGLHALKLK